MDKLMAIWDDDMARASDNKLEADEIIKFISDMKVSELTFKEQLFLLRIVGHTWCLSLEDMTELRRIHAKLVSANTKLE